MPDGLHRMFLFITLTLSARLQQLQEERDIIKILKIYIWKLFL